MLNLLPENIKTFFKYTPLGRNLKFYYQDITGKLPVPDFNFPQLLSLEVVSSCNLRCVHCPPQSREFKGQGRKLGVMDLTLFDRLMNEIDKYGQRRVALHKDGEPLLHPQINEILLRVKRNVNHNVYLTTNAHKLTPNISKVILDSRIDIVNFSIGAATEQFYEKVRGKNFAVVIDNIKSFLKAVKKSKWKPKVLVQIINLPEYREMKNEIRLFKKFWKNFDVQIQVWEKLNWGVYTNNTNSRFRYPCYSLWESFNVNSDGIVTACCMDWQQKLIAGNTNEESIHEIWHSDKLKNMRGIHIKNKTADLPLCDKCNYWSWQARIKNYKES